MSDYKYCFLEAKYDANPALYGVVLADDNFWKTAKSVVSHDELLSMSDKFITDFKQEDGYLKCSTDTPILELNSIVASQQGKERVTESSVSLFSLLYEGALNKFFIVDSVDGDCITEGFTSFRKIQFSRSTMTCFARISNSEGVYNKLIVTTDKCNPELHSFSFITPRDYSFSNPYCGFEKVVLVNGKEYNLWSTRNIPVYENCVQMSAPLINKAVQTAERYRAAQAVINDLLQIFVKKESKETAWRGGNKSYESVYRVLFKSTGKKFNTAAKNEITDFINSRLAEQSINEIKSEVMQRSFTPVQKFAGAYMLHVLSCINANPEEAVSTIVSTLNDINRTLFMSELYCYRVRLHTLTTKEHLTSSEPPVLSGGGERDVTFVEEVFSYDA